VVNAEDVLVSKGEVDLEGGVVGSMDYLFVVDVAVDEGLRDGVQPDDLPLGAKKQLCGDCVEELAVGDELESAPDEALLLLLNHI
jgi:hypothetical protein